MSSPCNPLIGCKIKYSISKTPEKSNEEGCVAEKREHLVSDVARTVYATGFTERCMSSTETTESLSEALGGGSDSTTLPSFPLSLLTGNVAIQSQMFAVIHEEFSLKGSIYEGGQSLSTLQLLGRYFEYKVSLQPENLSYHRLAEKFQRAQALENHYSEISKTGVNKGEALKKISSLSNQLAKEFQEMRPGESRLIPGGYTDSSQTGHAIAFEIEKQQDGTYSLWVSNSGDGVEYHPSPRSGWKKRVQQVVHLGRLSSDTFDATMIQALLEPYLLSRFIDPKSSNHVGEYSSKFLYGNVLGAIMKKGDGEFLPVNKEICGMMTTQRAGTCFWKSFLPVVRRELGLSEYKRFKHEIKEMTLLEYYQQASEVAEQNGGVFNKQVRYELLKACEKFSRHTLKLYSNGNGILTRDEAVRAHGVICSIQKAMEQAPSNEILTEVVPPENVADQSHLFSDALLFATYDECELPSADIEKLEKISKPQYDKEIIASRKEVLIGRDIQLSSDISDPARFLDQLDGFCKEIQALRATKIERRRELEYRLMTFSQCFPLSIDDFPKLSTEESIVAIQKINELVEAWFSVTSKYCDPDKYLVGTTFLMVIDHLFKMTPTGQLFERNKVNVLPEVLTNLKHPSCYFSDPFKQQRHQQLVSYFEQYVDFTHHSDHFYRGDDLLNRYNQYQSTPIQETMLEVVKGYPEGKAALDEDVASRLSSQHACKLMKIQPKTKEFWEGCLVRTCHPKYLPTELQHVRESVLAFELYSGKKGDLIDNGLEPMPFKDGCLLSGGEASVNNKSYRFHVDQSLSQVISENKTVLESGTDEDYLLSALKLSKPGPIRIGLAIHQIINKPIGRMDHTTWQDYLRVFLFHRENELINTFQKEPQLMKQLTASILDTFNYYIDRNGKPDFVSAITLLKLVDDLQPFIRKVDHPLANEALSELPNPREWMEKWIKDYQNNRSMMSMPERAILQVSHALTFQREVLPTNELLKSLQLAKTYLETADLPGGKHDYTALKNEFRVHETRFDPYLQLECESNEPFRDEVLDEILHVFLSCTNRNADWSGTYPIYSFDDKIYIDLLKNNVSSEGGILSLVSKTLSDPRSGVAYKEIFGEKRYAGFKQGELTTLQNVPYEGTFYSFVPHNKWNFDFLYRKFEDSGEIYRYLSKELMRHIIWGSHLSGGVEKMKDWYENYSVWVRVGAGESLSEWRAKDFLICDKKTQQPVYKLTPDTIGFEEIEEKESLQVYEGRGFCFPMCVNGVIHTLQGVPSSITQIKEDDPSFEVIKHFEPEAKFVEIRELGTTKKKEMVFKRFKKSNGQSLAFEFSDDEARLIWKENRSFRLMNSHGHEFEGIHQNYLMLQNDLGERKILIPDVTFEANGKIDPYSIQMVSSHEEVPYYELDLEPTGELKGQSTEARAFLAYMYAARKCYDKAQVCLKQVYAAPVWSQQTVEAIGELTGLAHNTGDPEMSAIALLVYLGFHDHNLYKGFQLTPKDLCGIRCIERIVEDLDYCFFMEGTSDQEAIQLAIQMLNDVDRSGTGDRLERLQNAMPAVLHMLLSSRMIKLYDSYLHNEANVPLFIQLSSSDEKKILHLLFADEIDIPETFASRKSYIEDGIVPTQQAVGGSEMTGMTLVPPKNWDKGCYSYVVQFSKLTPPSSITYFDDRDMLPLFQKWFEMMKTGQREQARDEMRLICWPKEQNLTSFTYFSILVAAYFDPEGPEYPRDHQQLETFRKEWMKKAEKLNRKSPQLIEAFTSPYNIENHVYHSMPFPKAPYDQSLATVETRSNAPVWSTEIVDRTASQRDVDLQLDESILQMQPIEEPLRNYFVKIEGASSTTESLFDSNEAKKSILVQSLEDDYALAQNQKSAENHYALISERTIEEFKSSLEASIDQTRELLLKKKETLLQLANRQPSEGQFVAELQVSGRKKDYLDLKSLKHLFLQGDVEQYYAKTYLLPHEVQLLHQQIFEYLLHSTEYRYKMNLLNDLSPIVNEPCDEAKEKLIHLLGKKVHVTRQKQAGVTYSDKKSRAQCILEESNGFYLREQQAAMLDSLLNQDANGRYENLTVEMIPGGGKTKVILPLQAMAKADGKAIPVIVVPESLYQTNLQDLSEQSYQLFGQEAKTFTLNRASRLTAYTLEVLKNKLDQVKADRGYLVLTPSTLGTLQLKYWEVLSELSGTKDANKTDELEELLLLLEDILQDLKQNGEAAIDEVHSNLDILKELVFTVGSGEHPELAYTKCSEFLFDVMCNPENYSLDERQRQLLASVNIQNNKQYLFPENRIDDLHQILAQAFYQKHQAMLKCSESDFVKHACGITIPSVEKEMESSSISSLVGVLRMQLTLFLDSTLNAKGGEDYGHSLIKNGPRYSIPYKGNNRPKEGSEFGHPLEAINYTLQTYLQKGLTTEDVVSLINKYKEQALREAKYEETVLSETKTSKRFFDFTGISLLDCYLESDDSDELPQYVERVKRAINSNASSIVKFVGSEILPTINVYDRQLPLNSHNLASMFSSVQGVTGTPYNWSSLPDDMRPLLAKGTQAGVLHTMLSRNRPIISCTKSSPKELLQELHDQGVDTQQFRAFIDTGGIFEGLTNREVAESLLQLNCDGVLFFDDETDKLAIMTPGPNVEVLGGSDYSLVKNKGYHPDRLVTYYDQSRALGTDLKQALKAQAILTVNKNTMTHKFVQGALRMRGLQQLQDVQIITTDRDAAAIFGDKQHTVQELIKHTYLREIDRIESDNLRSTKRKMHNILREMLCELIWQLPVHEKVAVYQRLKDSQFIEQTLKQDPRDCNKPQSMQEVYENLDDVRKSLLSSFFSLLQQCKPMVKSEALRKLLADKKNIQSILQKCTETALTRSLPKIVLTSHSQTPGVQVIRQIEVEKETETEMETELDLNIEKETQKGNIKPLERKWNWEGIHIFHPGSIRKLKSEQLIKLNAVTNKEVSKYMPKKVKAQKDMFDKRIYLTKNFYKTIDSQKQRFYSNMSKNAYHFLVLKNAGDPLFILCDIHDCNIVSELLKEGRPTHETHAGLFNAETGEAVVLSEGTRPEDIVHPKVLNSILTEIQIVDGNISQLDTKKKIDTIKGIVGHRPIQIEALLQQKCSEEQISEYHRSVFLKEAVFEEHDNRKNRKGNDLFPCRLL